jgi:peptidoglycan/xylan/chitin deacetylase (PgdA/CDA1 family)
VDVRSKRRVLGYHRVVDPADPSDPDPAVVSATPRDFERQMLHLATWYHVVSLEDVLAAQRGERVLPCNAVLITFDDACRDFAEVAWPILRRYELSATVFVPTAYALGPQPSFWWDRLYRAFRRTGRRAVVVPGLKPLSLAGPSARRAALRAVQQYVKSIPHHRVASVVDQLCRELGVEETGAAPVLDWVELRALAGAGVTLAAHTRSHPALTQVEDMEIGEEVAGSLRDLAREAASTWPVLCYPYGIHDDRVVTIVRKLGVELAFTCEDGHSKLPTQDPLRLPRTMITKRTSPLMFALRLQSAVTYLDRWRHRTA